MTDPYAEPGSSSSNLPETEKDQTLLILAILSYLVCGPFTAVPGFLMAREEKQRIERGELAPSGNVDVAYWLFVVNILLYAASIGVVILAALGIFIFSMV
jgi:hypothetical protein